MADQPTQLAGQATAEGPPAAARRRRLSGNGPRLAVGLLSVIAGLLAWDVYTRTAGDQLFTPTVPSIASAFWDLLGEREFWASYATTLEPFFYGWASALVLGLTLGLVMGLSRAVTTVSMPHLGFFNTLPVSTLVPVVVIVFGIDMVARSAVVFLFAIVEVTLTTASGVRFVDRDLMDMGRSFGLRRIRRLTRIILPGAAPGIAAAVRVGTGRAVVGMVVMELLLVSVGVGKLISRSRDLFQAPRLYAVVVSLAIFALAVHALMQALERRSQRWRGAAP